jgi:hypothetical protein
MAGPKRSARAGTPLERALTATQYFWAGAACLGSTVVLVMWMHDPTPLQGGVMAALMGLGGAFTTYGMAADLEIRIWVKASGPTAIFVILFLLLMKTAAPDVDFSSLIRSPPSEVRIRR